MTGGPRRVAGALVALAVVTGCGADGDPAPSPDEAVAAETSTTTAAPTDDATGDEPAPSVDAPGEVTVTAGEPPGFPSDFPRPDDADLAVGTSATVDGDRVLSLELTTAASVVEVIDFYRRAVEDAGFTALADEEGGLRFETGRYLGDVLAVGSGDGTAVFLTATFGSD